MNLFWIEAPPHGSIVHGNLNFPNCAALDWPDFSDLLHGTPLVFNSDDCTHFGSPVCIFFGGGAVFVRSEPCLHVPGHTRAELCIFSIA